MSPHWCGYDARLPCRCRAGLAPASGCGPGSVGAGQRGRTQPVFLGRQHLDELAAAPQEGTQLLCLRLRQRPRDRADGLGTVCQRPGIECIGLGQLPSGHGKVPRLPRMDWEPCGCHVPSSYHLMRPHMEGQYPQTGQGVSPSRYVQGIFREPLSSMLPCYCNQCPRGRTGMKPSATGWRKKYTNRSFPRTPT
jgi:hypothetical protein